MTLLGNGHYHIHRFKKNRELHISDYETVVGGPNAYAIYEKPDNSNDYRWVEGSEEILAAGPAERLHRDIQRIEEGSGDGFIVDPMPEQVLQFKLQEGSQFVVNTYVLRDKIASNYPLTVDDVEDHMYPAPFLGARDEYLKLKQLATEPGQSIDEMLDTIDQMSAKVNPKILKLMGRDWDT